MTECIFDKDLNDPEVLAELLRIEDECGDISAGRFGNNPAYWHNSLQHDPNTAERIEKLKAIVREEIAADESILDTKAFGDKHFQRPKSEIMEILSQALDCQDAEATREKAREAIAIAKKLEEAAIPA